MKQKAGRQRLPMTQVCRRCGDERRETRDERGRAKDGSVMREEEMWERAEVVLKEKEVVLEKLMARLKAVLGEGRYVNYKGVNGTVNICL